MTPPCPHIIGGADGPTSIFLTSKLAPELLGPIAIAAYSYMALVPVIQPPIMRALTTKKERAIKMSQLRPVSKTEKIIFPIAITTIVALILPDAAPLIGCLMLGNLAKECGVVDRLSKTMQNELMNIVVIFLGLTVGATATASSFLDWSTIKIMVMGVVAFGCGTAGGILLAKLMNVFSKEKINRARVHATKSGVTHFVAATEEEAMQEVRRLISFIPQNNMEEAPVKECKDDPARLEDALNSMVPDDPNKPYDMKDIIYSIVDDGDFMEVHKDFAKNVICGFARFNGRSTGIIANQPNWLAGVLDCDASRKAARFVRFCDAFNIQILTLVDVPGFLCGTGQEYAGIIDHGAKLMFAYGEATVPKVTVTVRKSYGGSHIVMSCKQLRGDLCYAWPNAEIAVMGASGAVGVLEAKALKAIEDPEEKKKFIAEKEAAYKDKFASPYQAANRGYIDDVIEPRFTRARVIRAFEMLQTKRLTNPLKKHSNIPL